MGSDDMVDEKPKRKRDDFSNEINFVTALTVEECVERLERGPARTLDYRLSVRTDGTRFKIEVLGNNTAMVVLAEVDGYLWAEKNSRLRPGIPATKVLAHIEINKSLNPSGFRWMPLLWPLIVLVIGLSDNQFNMALLVDLGLLPTALLLALFHFLWKWQATRINSQIPDLRQWLMQQIYEPPGAPEE